MIEVKRAGINEHVLRDMSALLILKGYSKKTIKTYLNEMGAFLKHIKKHQAADFGPVRLKAYFLYCHEVLFLSAATVHSRMNALKFYYGQVLDREECFVDIPRPKKPIQLPKVISEEKIIAGLLAVENLKQQPCSY